MQVRDTRAVYALAVLTCGSAVLGYAATRLVAFPDLDDHVGNWLEPLGVFSIVAETTVAALRRRRTPARHRLTQPPELRAEGPHRPAHPVMRDQLGHQRPRASASAAAAATRPIRTP